MELLVVSNRERRAGARGFGESGLNLRVASNPQHVIEKPLSHQALVVGRLSLEAAKFSVRRLQLEGNPLPFRIQENSVWHDVIGHGHPLRLEAMHSNLAFRDPTERSARALQGNATVRRAQIMEVLPEIDCLGRTCVRRNGRMLFEILKSGISEEVEGF